MGMRKWSKPDPQSQKVRRDRLSRRVLLEAPIALVIAVLVALVVYLGPGGGATDLGKPSKPNLSVVEEGVRLDWDAPLLDPGAVTGYEFDRRRPLSDDTRRFQVTVGAQTESTTFTDNGATEAGARYMYRVRAVRKDEVSKSSNFVGIFTIRHRYF